MKKWALLLTYFIATNVTAGIIETISSWNGTDFISPFGEENTATYGQTFTVGSENVLDNFTFFLNDNVNPDSTDFEAFVMEWNGDMAIGSILFQSSALSTTNNNGNGGFEEFSISTGGLTLNSGSQYVAFFSASNLFDSLIGTSSWGGLSGADAYAGGQFVYQNNGANFLSLTSSNWTKNHQGTGSDTAFSMTFSTTTADIPEPSTIAIFALGMMGISARRLAKK